MQERGESSTNLVLLPNRAFQGWEGTLPTERKNLLRRTVRSAFVRGDTFVALQPTEAELEVVEQWRRWATFCKGEERPILSFQCMIELSTTDYGGILLTRQTLEKYQVLIYLAATACGLTFGIFMPGWTEALATALWPVLAFLLYTTFTQVPLVHLRQAMSDTRFINSALIGNFLLIPIFVWGITQFLPNDPAIRLGVLLVLLVPCTDWFITFTHLGGGDTKYAISFSPISLLLQIVFLPLYLWLFLGESLTVTVARQEMIAAFVGLIALPLLGAFVTEKWVEQGTRRAGLLDKLAWLPIPLLGLVVFIIAATQVNLVTTSLDILGQLLFVYVGFLILAGLLARVLAHLFGLPASQGRVLAFSMGTRNSFVVLPLALALPPAYNLAIVAIVFQSLIELLGMAFYLWWVPKKLFPQPNENKSESSEVT